MNTKKVEQKIVEKTEQEMVFDNINRIHGLVNIINLRQSHIIFYEMIGHVNSLRISIRHKDDYQINIMDLECSYRLREDDDVYNNNILNKLDAIGQVLLKLIHNPEISTMKEIVTVVDDDNVINLVEDDNLPF